MIGEVKLEGMDELEHAMFRMKGTTAKSNTRAAAKLALEPMAKEARSLAPIDEGYLQEGIEITSKARPRYRMMSPMEMYMGPGPSPQAVMQEFGTVHHSPTPFMRPAWDKMAMTTLDMFGAILWLRIEKAAERAARKAQRRIEGGV